MERVRVPQDDAFAFVYGRGADDDRRLRAALIAAAIAHAGLLFVVFPQSTRVVEPPTRAHYIEPTTTYRPPKPEPTPPPERVEPKQHVRRIPMPAPAEAPIELMPIEPIQAIMPVGLETTPIPVTAIEIPAPPPAPPAEPIRVSGASAPKRIHFVQPRYTEMARRARREGLVILEAVIGRSGAVESVDVLRALPFGLTESAIHAVRQWRYEPPRVNGHPVPVRMTVTVRFGIE